jgi:putative endonuclease
MWRRPRKTGPPFLFVSRVSEKPYFTYVLWSPKGERFYVGISEDPVQRLAQHNAGISGWTTRYRPWRLVYTEQHADYTAARKREIELKAQNGGHGFFAMTGLSPIHFGKPSGSRS